jgi:hypothetical protein
VNGNEGIVQLGGNMRLANVAVGRGATVNVGAADQQAEIGRLLTELHTMLAVGGGQRLRSTEAAAAINEVSDELSCAEPSRTRLSMLLDRVRSALIAAGLLAEPAVKLAETINQALDNWCPRRVCCVKRS